MLKEASLPLNPNNAGGAGHKCHRNADGHAC